MKSLAALGPLALLLLSSVSSSAFAGGGGSGSTGGFIGSPVKPLSFTHVLCVNEDLVPNDNLLDPAALGKEFKLSKVLNVDVDWNPEGDDLLKDLQTILPVSEVHEIDTYVFSSVTKTLYEGSAYKLDERKLLHVCADSTVPYAFYGRAFGLN